MDITITGKPEIMSFICLERNRWSRSENGYGKMTGRAWGSLRIMDTFAVNVLVKAFGYDSSDQIYKFFMLSGVILLGMKLVTTRYTLREIVVIALMLGAGLFIWVMTKNGDDTVFVFNDHRNQGCVFPEID